MGRLYEAWCSVLTWALSLRWCWCTLPSSAVHCKLMSSLGAVMVLFKVLKSRYRSTLRGDLSWEPSGPFSPVEHVDDYRDSGSRAGRGRSNAGLCHCNLHNDSCSLQLIAQAFCFREIMYTGNPGKGERLRKRIVNAGGKKKCRCYLEIFK